ncbi:MAG: hypothetical protein HYY16_00070 [Planctomycetes bacterium]|nr:hypothetical protein [Planctomycetota bacterium]
MLALASVLWMGAMSGAQDEGEGASGRSKTMLLRADALGAARSAIDLASEKIPQGGSRMVCGIDHQIQTLFADSPEESLENVEVFFEALK